MFCLFISLGDRCSERKLPYIAQITFFFLLLSTDRFYLCIHEQCSVKIAAYIKKISPSLECLWKRLNVTVLQCIAVRFFFLHFFFCFRSFNILQFFISIIFSIFSPVFSFFESHSPHSNEVFLIHSFIFNCHRFVDCSLLAYLCKKSFSFCSSSIVAWIHWKEKKK